MFKLFKRKNKLKIIEQKKTYIKPEINKLFQVAKTNNMIKLDILKKHRLVDFCNFKIELEKYKDLGLNNLNLRHIINSGGNWNNQDIFKQSIYIFKHDNIEYVIAVSDTEIKISESTLIDKDTYESTLDIDIPQDKFLIGKYIHDEYKSTSYNKWYPMPDGFFNLNEELAIETTKNLLHNLSNFMNAEELYAFIKKHTNWNFEYNHPKGKQKILQIKTPLTK